MKVDPEVAVMCRRVPGYRCNAITGGECPFIAFPIFNARPFFETYEVIELTQPTVGNTVKGAGTAQEIGLTCHIANSRAGERDGEGASNIVSKEDVIAKCTYQFVCCRHWVLCSYSQSK
jgi:hypothetical protein